jgi:predicted phosphodiesterase
MDQQKVTIISDIHLGYEDSTEVVLNKLEEIQANTEVCLLLGDIIHESSTDIDMSRLQSVADILNTKFRTVYVVPGNHDCPHIETETFVSYFDNDLPEIVTVGSTDILLIDSGSKTPYKNTGFISEESLEEVVNYTRSEGTECFVIASHFPLHYFPQYRKSEHFSKYPEGVFPLNKFEYEKCLSEVNTPDAVLSGHLHFDAMRAFQTDVETTQFLFAPFGDLDDESSDLVNGQYYEFNFKRSVC